VLLTRLAKGSTQGALAPTCICPRPQPGFQKQKRSPDWSAVGPNNCCSLPIILRIDGSRFRPRLSLEYHKRSNKILTKPRPEAGCMRCGRPYIGSVERTVMCARPNTTGMQCNGRIAWRPNPEDWTQCPVCAGTGGSADKACEHCHGDGWLMGKR
jgi:hypothetical protein